MFSRFFIAKTTDLALRSVYFFFFGLIASIVLNFLTEVYETYTMSDRKAEKSTPRLMFEIVSNIFFILFTLWVIRNGVERIPFPLEGYGGYTAARISLPTINTLTSLILFFFQTALMDKIRLLNSRIFATTGLEQVSKIVSPLTFGKH